MSSLPCIDLAVATAVGQLLRFQFRFLISFKNGPDTSSTITFRKITQLSFQPYQESW